MTGSYVSRVLLVAATCASTVTYAAPPTTVFPLSAPSLPVRFASAPEELSRAISDAIDGTVAKVPIDDAALLLECDAESTSCLGKVARQYKSERIVFGTIKFMDDDELKVTLTRYDTGPDREQRTYTVKGDLEDMAKQLVESSRELFGGSANAGGGEEEDEPDGDEPDTPSGSVSGPTWAILGSGVLVTGIGVGFLYSSNQISNDVQGLPRETRADFDRLTALEDKGSQRLVIGEVLTVVGVAAIVYGVVRAIQDRRTPPPDAVSITPMPLRGGGGIALTLEWP